MPLFCQTALERADAEVKKGDYVFLTHGMITFILFQNLPIFRKWNLFCSWNTLKVVVPGLGAVLPASSPRLFFQLLGTIIGSLRSSSDVNT